jgi:hypothetical protein
VVLWMAQALRALDRMTPNATTTKAQRAAVTPTDVVMAGYVLLAAGGRWDGSRGAGTR